MNKQTVLDLAYDVYKNVYNKERTFLPIMSSGADISPEDVVAVINVALNGWFTEYNECALFRRELKKISNKNHIQLCNSGSSASLLALSAASKVYGGKFVITTALSFPTAVASIYQNGYIPIFVDVDPATLEPVYEQVRHWLSMSRSGTMGIILTHILGFPFKEKYIRNMIDGTGTFFIADCCDALGARLNDEEPVGTYADMATYSFFPAHQITTGEGGCVITNEAELFRIMQSLANWGRDCWCLPGQSNVCGKRFEHKWKNLPEGWDHKYTFTNLGYNLKMTDLQGTLGLSQIKRLPQFVEARRKNYKYLYDAFKPFGGIVHLITPNDHSSPFGFPITLLPNSPFTINEFISYLEKKQIKTRRMFAANITRQPMLESMSYCAADLSGSDYLLEKAFWIGCHPSLSQKQLDYMVNMIQDFLVRY